MPTMFGLYCQTPVLEVSSSEAPFSPCKGCLALMVVHHQRSYSIEGRLPLKVLFHQKLSFIKVSSIKSHLPSKVIFHQRVSNIKGCLTSKVVFHQISSSIKGKVLLYKIHCKLTITHRQASRKINLI